MLTHTDGSRKVPVIIDSRDDGEVTIGFGGT